MIKIMIIAMIISMQVWSSYIEEVDLLGDLHEASEVSTKTKLNVNKTPSIISVLHSNELQSLGIKSVYEALKTVPGVQLSIGNGGAKKINMRGNTSLLKDKLKVLIDGVSVNCDLTGGGYYLFLDMPIEMVERMEIIRGPAATIYGSQAHVGVINIITKSSTKNKNIYFAQRSSKGKEDIGFTQHLDVGDMKLSLDGYFKENKSATDIGRYEYVNALGNQAIINQSTSYEDYTNYSIGSQIKFLDDLSFNLRFSKHNTQNYYGYGDWPITHDPRDVTTTSNFGEIRYTPSLNKELSLDLRAGVKEYIFEGDGRLKPLATVLGTPYDLIGVGFVRQITLYTDSSLKYKYNKHNILLGTYLSEAQQIYTHYYFNNPSVSEDMNILNHATEPDTSRYQSAVYFNDIYNLSEKILINLGARFDHYNDAEENLAHKLAFVYNQDEQQTYKLMYQRSFRVPSWLELYGRNIPFQGNKNLKSEIIDTLELGYNFQKKLDQYVNINLFYSKLKHYINNDNAYTFYNDKDIRSFGLELDAKTSLGSSSSLQANYSYVDIGYKDGGDLPFVANHLANVMFIHDLSKNWNVGTYVSYVGKKEHSSGDTRPEVDGYTTFDQAVTYKEKGFSLQLSVKNLFDEEIIEPSQLGNTDSIFDATTVGFSVTAKGTYIDDYRRDGRTFWISAKWEFE